MWKPERGCIQFGKLDCLRRGAGQRFSDTCPRVAPDHWASPISHSSARFPFTSALSSQSSLTHSFCRAQPSTFVISSNVISLSDSLIPLVTLIPSAFNSFMKLNYIITFSPLNILGDLQMSVLFFSPCWVFRLHLLFSSFAKTLANSHRLFHCLGFSKSHKLMTWLENGNQDRVVPGEEDVCKMLTLGCDPERHKAMLSNTVGSDHHVVFQSK